MGSTTEAAKPNRTQHCREGNTNQTGNMRTYPTATLKLTPFAKIEIQNTIVILFRFAKSTCLAIGQPCPCVLVLRDDDARQRVGAAASCGPHSPHKNRRKRDANFIVPQNPTKKGMI